MRYIGVDPGALFTGIAVQQEDKFVFWSESEDPCVIWEIIFQNSLEIGLTVILEDYLGSGPRNKYNKQTTEVLGYIYLSCRGANIKVHRVSPQRRLPCVSLVPPYICGKDARAAAAHVLAFRERIANGRTN